MRLAAWPVLAIVLIGTGGAVQAAGRGCGPDIGGLSALLRPGATVLLGEIHGTAEVPRFVGDVACRAVAGGLEVVLALEIPAAEDPAFAHYLGSRGTAADRARLLGGEFWNGPPDGRSSRAMAALMERIRRLRARGAPAGVYGMIGGGGAADSEAAMADRLLALRRKHPRALLLALAGNNHTRVGPWPNGPTNRAMGQHLQDARLPDLISLDLTAASGTFFGVSGRVGVHTIKGTDPSGRRFVKLARDAGPFDGRFHVGRLTASLPAAVRPPASSHAW